MVKTLRDVRAGSGQGGQSNGDLIFFFFFFFSPPRVNFGSQWLVGYWLQLSESVSAQRFFLSLSGEQATVNRRAVMETITKAEETT